VVVTPAKIPAKMADPDGAADASDDEVCPVAVVVNNGRFTITNLDARFGMGTAIYPARQMEYYSGYPALPQELVSGLGGGCSNKYAPSRVCGDPIHRRSDDRTGFAWREPDRALDRSVGDSLGAQARRGVAG